MSILKPCLSCGTPSPKARCAACSAGSTKARGYSGRWAALSRRARALQPFCSVTGCTSTDLTLDHLNAEAWRRYERGLSIRLGIDAIVLCRSHNGAKGAARYGDNRTRQPQTSTPESPTAPGGPTPPPSRQTTAGSRESRHSLDVEIDGVI